MSAGQFLIKGSEPGHCTTCSIFSPNARLTSSELGPLRPELVAPACRGVLASPPEVPRPLGMRPAMIEWADYTDTSRCQFTVVRCDAADAMDANMKHVRYESAVVAAGSQAEKRRYLYLRGVIKAAVTYWYCG